MNSMQLGKGMAIITAVCALHGATASGQFTAWTPNNGNATYYSGGGMSGQAWTPNGGNTTYYSGSMFRGADGGSVLFESPDFSSRFSADAWIGATGNRDVAAMTGVAWSLKAVETILGKQDKKTTSDAMFKAAAQVAVEQKNSAALTEIVALCPACKSYQDELKAAGQSRGAASTVAMPQIVYPNLGAFDAAKPDAYKKLVDGMTQNLKPWETPILTPDLVRFSFRGISTPEAENVATMVNRGRQTEDPAMLAQAAVSLSGQKATVENSYVNPQKMLEEATGLALLLNDKKTVTQIVDIYENDAFGVLKDEGRAQTLASELKTMGGSRGGEADAMLPLLKPSYVVKGVPGLTGACVGAGAGAGFVQ
jgi:hypothetical protein